MLKRFSRFLNEKGALELTQRIGGSLRSNIYMFRHSKTQGLNIAYDVQISGRPYISFGRNVTLGRRCRIEAIARHGNHAYTPELRFGENTALNDDVHIACISSVHIGRDVLMASKIYISDHLHGNYSGAQQDRPDVPPNHRPLSIKPVVIEDNVWIGEMVSILPGATIGFGSIIGANSVVTGVIPPNSIAVGAPARVIKTFNQLTGYWDRI